MKVDSLLKIIDADPRCKTFLGMMNLPE